MYSERDIWVTRMKIEDMRKAAEHNRLVQEALRERKAHQTALKTASAGVHQASLLAARLRGLERRLSQVFYTAGQSLVEAGSWLESRAREPELNDGGCG